MFIDTHCHLEDENFSDDREKVLERAKAAGVERIINFGSTLKSSAAVVELAKIFRSCMRASAFTPKRLTTSTKKLARAWPNSPQKKKSSPSEKSVWIIIGKKIRRVDFFSKKFLLSSSTLRGN